MQVFTGRIGDVGNSCSEQSPEFLLVNLSILMASCYRHCLQPQPSDLRLLRAGCSCGLEEALILVFSIGNCWTMSQRCHSCNGHSQHLWISLLYSGSMIPGKICYKVCQLATTDPCIADILGNLLSLLQRLILMTHATTVILPCSYQEVYLLNFYGEEELFSLSRGILAILAAGLDHMDLDTKVR